MRSSPVQVGTGYYKLITAGNNTSTVIDPYGTLTAWGDNLYGQQGTNTTNDTLSWTQLSNGDAHSLGLLSDGRLYAWGLNTSGQLGTGDTVARQSPTQISANIGGTITSNFVSVSAGASHSVAISSDNVAYGWGLNTSGQVGDITVVSRSAPVQIGIGGVSLNYSVLFSNGVDYLSLNTATMNIGTNAFTIEAWVYVTSLPDSFQAIFGASTISTNGFGIAVLNTNSTDWQLYVGNGSSWTINSQAVSWTNKFNTWTHFAISRTGGTLYFFLNGVLTYSVSNATNIPSTFFAIGAQVRSGFNFNGYISNFRVLIGTGLYTTGFTPSVSPFSNIANTVLLTCNGPTIIDSSSNNLTITNTNTSAVTVSTTVNPFIYYSGSFNGTNQYLNIANNSLFELGSSYTIEAYVYLTSLPTSGNNYGVVGYNYLAAGSFSGWVLYINSSGNPGLGTYSGGIANNKTTNTSVVSGSIVANTWNHVAMTVNGTSVNIYTNGILVTTAVLGTPDYVGATLSIGRWNYSTAYRYLPGYISNVRLVQGVIVYTGNFAVPTNILRTIQVSGTNITALSGAETTLLTLQNSTLIDNSTNNFTITNNNSVIVSSTIAPFAASPPATGTGVFIANKISAGKDYTIAMKSDNTLWSWGLNAGYQLGSGTTSNRSSPVQVGSSSWLQISAGASHALAIDSNNTLYGWGTNANGQVTLLTPISWTQVFTTKMIGATSTYALRQDGSLWVWGGNNVGQLGLGDTIHRSSPVQLGSDSWTFVSGAGGDITVPGISPTVHAIRSDGTLWGWGYNLTGKIGDNTSTNKSSPVQITGVGYSSWNFIHSNHYATAGITSDGKLWTWGNNFNGNLGEWTVTPIGSTRSVPSSLGTDSWGYIGSGYQNFLAIKSNGTLWVWGANNYNQLGTGDAFTVTRSSPVQVAAIGTGSWTQVSGAQTQMLGLQTDGSLYTWGTGTSGERGDGTTVGPVTTPAKLGTLTYSKIAAHQTANNPMSFALTTDGKLYAFGGNSDGGLGDGTTIHRSSPVQISATTSWTNIAGSAAINNTSNLFTWGYNIYGQSGQGDTAYRSNPVQLSGIAETVIPRPKSIGTSSWSVVSAGYTHSMAITSDNRLFTWGNNTNGQLGFNRYFTSVTAGNSVTMAIRNDGTLWQWGLGTSGQLGQTDIVSRSSPVQVGLLLNWSKITRATLNSYAIDSLGKLYAWGENSVGSIGDGTTVSKSSPVQIGSSSWIMVATGGTGTAGQQTTYAITSNKLLFGWGFNNNGQLGDGTTVNRSNPVQIGSSSWNVVSGGTLFAMAITTDGGIFSWGLNTNGQLGLNDVASRSAPVQIGSSSWSQVSAGGSHVIGVKSDNTIFAWGLNTAGQLGDGTVISRSSPVQVGTVSSSLSNPNAYSLSFNGTNQYLTTASNAGLDIGTGDFTFEVWIYNSAGDWGQLTGPYGIYGDTSTTQVYLNTGGQLQIVGGGTLNQVYTMSGGSYSLNTWYHIAIVRISGTLVFYINGTAVKTVTGQGTNSLSFSSGSIGRIDYTGNKYLWKGYLSNLRIVNGVGVYTGNFTTPSTPLTATQSAGTNISAITGTQTGLLTLQNTTIVDNSSNNITITNVGTVTYSLQTPFTSAIGSGALFATLVSAGNSHSVAIDTGNKLFAWGLGSSGQLGISATANRSAPVQIGLSTNWNNISAGANYTVGLTDVGTYYGWGLNTGGPIGDSTSTGYSSPVIVTSTSLPNTSSPIQVGTSSYTLVSAGNNISTAISTDQKLFNWGLNTTGQLGVGQTTSRSSPVQIGTNSYNLIGAGGTHITFVSNISPQNILATGLNTSGQLGDMSTTSRSSPTQVGSRLSKVNTPATISTGNYSSYYVSSPTQVGTSSWITVTAGGTHTLGVKKDYTLWSWGYNANGQLGYSDTINRSSPVQIGTSSWITVSAGDSHNMAINSDGTISSFGINSYGQLGDGT